MEKSLFKYIWKYSVPQQTLILIITVVSFPILYYSLELPKLIVNDAIEGNNFPREFLGLEFDQIEYLFLLSFAFLFLVVANNGIKFALNIYKGLLGERMLRRLRYDLYFRILRFRLPQFRKMSAGEIIPMITAEVEALGGFIGDAFATPAYWGGTLVVYFVFITVQSPVLGVAAVALYPLQMWIIPKMQKRVIRMTRLRVKNIRRLSDRIGESITGVTEIHANDASRWHLAEISARLYENFKIRFEIFLWKYLIKFTNNIINQLTPFFFYLFGGYLVIQEEMNIGALVAVIAAYKDLAGPWKELLAYYQEAVDVQVKYQTVVENYDLPDLYPVNRFVADPPEDVAIDGSVKFDRVSLGEPGTGHCLDNVSFSLAPGERAAIVGGDSSGRSETLQIMAGLLAPRGGRALLGNHSVEDLPESVLGRAVSYLSGNLHIFTGTIRTNVYYGLRRYPVEEAADDPEWIKAAREAGLTDNSPHNFDADWDDHTLAGVESRDHLDARAVLLLYKVGFGADLYRMGMQVHIEPAQHPDLVEKVLRARRAVAERVAADSALQNAIVLWDPDALNPSATLAENVLFALPADGSTELERLPGDPLVMAFLEKADLKDDLVEIGLATAQTMIDLFADVSADNAVLSEFSFIRTEDLPVYEQRVAQVKASGVGALSKEAVSDLIGVAFKLIPARHRLGVLEDRHIEKIVAARPLFRKMLTESGRSDFVPFAEDVYIGAQSIGDNLIFGKVRLDRRDARARIDRLVGDIVTEQSLRAPISLAGLDFDVGIAGNRLSGGQRQKIALVRALLKRPTLLVIDDVATSGSEEDGQLLEFVRTEFTATTIVLGAPRVDLVAGFERIIYMKEGQVVANGSYEDVAQKIRAQESPA